MAAHSSNLAWKFHGQRSLAGSSPWGCEESDATLQLLFSLFSDRLMGLTWHAEEQSAQECNSSEWNEEERDIRISVSFITEKEILKMKYAESDGKLEKINLI